MDRRWWNPILLFLAALALAGLIALIIAKVYSWRAVTLGGIAAGSLLTLFILSISRNLGQSDGHIRRRWFDRLDGSCPECGYPGEGIEGARCPECNGHIPPGLDSVVALQAVHNTSGPAECVVCHRVHTDLEPGFACPNCGSRRRRPIQSHTPASPDPAR